jgi:hypothetical protein
MVRRVADKEILKLVTQRLARTGLASQTPLTVTVHHGNVAVSGTINFEFQRKVALKAVQGIDGVSHVVDHLRVQPAVAKWHVPHAGEHAAKPHPAPLASSPVNTPAPEGGEHPSVPPITGVSPN